MFAYREKNREETVGSQLELNTGMACPQVRDEEVSQGSQRNSERGVSSSWQTAHEVRGQSRAEAHVADRKRVARENKNPRWGHGALRVKRGSKVSTSN